MRDDGQILAFPRRLAERLGAWAELGYPRETCGLLIGTTTGTEVVVVDILQARNLNRERARDRYELAPDDWIAADLEARRQGREVVGIWHSHPDHPAEPSVTDLEHAWHGYSYLIASVTRKGVQDMRSWRLSEKTFVEEKIEGAGNHGHGHDSHSRSAAQPHGGQRGGESQRPHGR